MYIPIDMPATKDVPYIMSAAGMVTTVVIQGPGKQARHAHIRRLAGNLNSQISHI